MCACVFVCASASSSVRAFSCACGGGRLCVCGRGVRAGVRGWVEAVSEEVVWGGCGVGGGVGGGHAHGGP
jgi:hypothetical protein